MPAVPSQCFQPNDRVRVFGLQIPSAPGGGRPRKKPYYDGTVLYSYTNIEDKLIKCRVVLDTRSKEIQHTVDCYAGQCSRLEHKALQYYVTEQQLKWAGMMRALRTPWREIEAMLNVGPDWLRKHYAEEVEKHTYGARATIRQLQWEKATKEKNVSMLKWLGQIICGQDPREQLPDGEDGDDNNEAIAVEYRFIDEEEKQLSKPDENKA